MNACVSMVSRNVRFFAGYAELFFPVLAFVAISTVERSCQVRSKKDFQFDGVPN